MKHGVVHVKATIAEKWSAWSPSPTVIATIVENLFSYNAVIHDFLRWLFWPDYRIPAFKACKFQNQVSACGARMFFFLDKFCLNFSLNTHTQKAFKGFYFLSPWCFFLLSFLLLSSIPTSRNSDLGQRLSSFTTARRCFVWWSVKSGGLFSLQTCESRLGERSIELTLRADTFLPDLLYVLTLAAVSTLVLPVLKECSLLILQICISQFCN